MAADFSLPPSLRDATAARLASSLVALSFARGAALDPESAAATAAAAERKAYTTACVEARTTTGTRPAAETLRAYARKLAELGLEAVKAGPSQAAPAPSATTPADEIDLSGGREFLDADTATAALAPLLAPGAAHTRVRLSTKSFGVDAAEVAARALANVSRSLRHADLSDVVAGRPEADALAALRVLADALAAADLHTLDVSDNALGEKGVRALAAALGGCAATLRALAVRNVGASVHACAALADILTHAPELRALELHNNMSGCDGAASIARLVGAAPGLTHFRMASSRVGPDGGAALAAALAASPGRALVSLDLSDNPLTGAVGAPLAALVRAHAGLTRLVLADTGLGDGGVAAVAAALAAPGAPSLVELDLSLTEMTEVGAAALAAALPRQTKLVKLSVRENELGNAGARALARGLAALAAASGGDAALAHVDACANEIRRPGAAALARAAAACGALAFLGLDENEISDDGVEEVAEILRGAGKGDALGPMDDNMAASDEEEEGEDDADEGMDDGDAAADGDGGDADELAARVGAVHIL